MSSEEVAAEEEVPEVVEAPPEPDVQDEQEAVQEEVEEPEPEESKIAYVIDFKVLVPY